MRWQDSCAHRGVHAFAVGNFDFLTFSVRLIFSRDSRLASHFLPLASAVFDLSTP
jgi:hypothetical protein